MRIIDRITGDIYDVMPEDIIEKEMNSPVFSDTGSMSLPFRLAPTVKNRSLLGYPDMFALTTKANVKRDVILDEDGLHTCATMCLIDANEEEYNVTVGFNDGDAYNKMQNVKLTEMNIPKWFPQIFVQAGPDYFDSLEGVNAMCHIAQKWMNGSYNYDDDFRIFPVLIQRDVDEQTKKVYYTMQNELVEGDIFTTRPLLGASTFKKTVYQDSEECEITFIKGYSIAPYWRVYRVLDKIVRFLGYEIDYNVFESDTDLNKLCVLHNVMDACCVDEIDINKLLPDCTITDFIEALNVRFGAYLFFDSQTLKVRIDLLSNIFKKAAKTDLTNYVSTKRITFATPSYLSLTASSSLELTSPEVDTYEEFARKHNHICNAQEEGLTFSNTKIINMRYRRATGEYYMMRKVVAAGTLGEFYRVSSNCFDYNKQEKDYEEVSKSSPDEFVATFSEDKDKLVNAGVPIELPFVAKLLMPYYSATAKHINTIYRGSGESEEDGSDTPIAFAFYRGKAVNYNGANLGYSYASTQAYDNMGKNKVGVGLHFAGEDGLFEAYWKDYDAMLRHSNHEIECEMALPFAVFRSLRMDEPVIFHGKRCLIASIKQSGDNYTVKLNTMDPLTPNELASEQAIPVMKKQEYYWSSVNYEDADTAAEVEKIRKRYTNEAEGISCEVTYKVKSKEVPTNDDFKYVAMPSKTDEEFIVKYKKVLDVTVTIYNSHAGNNKYFDQTMYYRAGLRSVYNPTEV